MFSNLLITMYLTCCVSELLPTVIYIYTVDSDKTYPLGKPKKYVLTEVRLIHMHDPRVEICKYFP